MRDVPAPAFLAALTSMTVLSIHHTTFAEGSESSPDSLKPPCVSRLQHLILSTNLSSIYGLVLSAHAPKLTHVRKLLLRVDPFIRFHVEHILSSADGTLEEPEVDCGEFSSPVKLPHLPKLRSLTLRIYIGLI
ncbi:hypothetical protein FB451DRAFT_1307022 [Mycena latifolia]|nr:hypothetical protein FB451DRAFT_1307022 [Mycena latifolia]